MSGLAAVRSAQDLIAPPCNGLFLLASSNKGVWSLDRARWQQEADRAGRTFVRSSPFLMKQVMEAASLTTLSELFHHLKGAVPTIDASGDGKRSCS